MSQLPGNVSSASLSLILPVLNEEESLNAALVRTVDALSTLVREFEIIVVNDGSSDRTGEIADAFSARDQRVRVIHNERNLNYGISLQLGFQAARFEWVTHNGADLPLAPEAYGPFVAAFESADVVVASNREREAHSPWRKITSRTNRTLLALLFSPRTHDLNFTQFYRRKQVRELPIRSTSPAFTTPELILRSEHQGRRVVELQAVFSRRESGRAHFGRPKDILWTLRDMLHLRVRTALWGWNS